MKEKQEWQKKMKKYSATCDMAKQKKDDLLKLCTKNLIPARHHAFYEVSTQTKKDDTKKAIAQKKKHSFALWIKDITMF